jgi:hypothetical protein
MNASNLLCKPLVPIYKNFKEFNQETFFGYKLVEKMNLNYYSIATGLFRYKEGSIKNSSYTSLYEKNPEFYNENLHNRISIFKTKEDAILFLEEYKNLCLKDSELVVLEIIISKNLQEAKCSNEFIENIDVVIGGCIDFLKEI